MHARRRPPKHSRHLSPRLLVRSAVCTNHRYPQGSGLVARPFRNAHTSHRRCSVRAGLGTVQKRQQIVPQGQPIVVGRLSVHARSSIRSRAVECLYHPGKVQVVVERREPQLRRLLRQLRYPLLFRGHGIRFLSTGHVSLQQFRNPAPPSLRRVPAGWVPRLHRYYEALRFPTDRLAALRGASRGDTSPCACIRLSAQVRRRPAARSLWSGAPRPDFRRGEVRASQVPGEPWCVYALFFDPGGTRRTKP